MTPEQPPSVRMEPSAGYPDPGIVLLWLKERLKSRRMAEPTAPPEERPAADVVPLRR